MLNSKRNRDSSGEPGTSTEFLDYQGHSEVLEQRIRNLHEFIDYKGGHLEVLGLTNNKDIRLFCIAKRARQHARNDNQNLVPEAHVRARLRRFHLRQQVEKAQA